MRAGAIELAARAKELAARDASWDLVLCTDMMNAAEWRGLAPPGVGSLPLVVYFHENQAAYPVPPERGPDPRDVHFVLTNMISALAADEAWFNSSHNLATLAEGLDAALASIPEAGSARLAQTIVSAARIEPPGVDDALFDIDHRQRPPGPLRILWAARWEFDKRPEVLGAAIDMLAQRGVDFRLDLLGGPEGDPDGTPPAATDASDASGAIARLRARHPERVGRFGRARSREDFVKALAEADVIVSAAAHEFFGLAVVEAVAAGAMALVPRALAYPEVLGEDWEAFHDGTPESVCAGLERLARRLAERGSVWSADPGAGRARVEGCRWSVRAPVLDAALERAAAGHRLR